ncbi:hypothetical protein OF83DRAFT_1088811 [Amylostereum chailletii]|nr:hypothetical protein OF83DRAFT_1088811 [Amylostereum chailletii]
MSEQMHGGESDNISCMVPYEELVVENKAEADTVLGRTPSSVYIDHAVPKYIAAAAAATISRNTMHLSYEMAPSAVMLGVEIERSFVAASRTRPHGIETPPESKKPNVRRHVRVDVKRNATHSLRTGFSGFLLWGCGGGGGGGGGKKPGSRCGELASVGKRYMFERTVYVQTHLQRSKTRTDKGNQCQLKKVYEMYETYFNDVRTRKSTPWPWWPSCLWRSRRDLGRLSEEQGSRHRFRDGDDIDGKTRYHDDVPEGEVGGRWMAIRKLPRGQGRKGSERSVGRLVMFATVSERRMSVESYGMVVEMALAD